MSETARTRDPREIVERLADESLRADLVYQALIACGPSALEARRRAWSDDPIVL
jgi:hypothetical protein